MNEWNGIHYQYVHGSSFAVHSSRMGSRPGDDLLWLNSAAMIINADTDHGPNSIGWIVMWVGEPPGEWKTVEDGGELPKVQVNE